MQKTAALCLASLISSRILNLSLPTASLWIWPSLAKRQLSWLLMNLQQKTTLTEASQQLTFCSFMYSINFSVADTDEEIEPTEMLAGNDQNLMEMVKQAVTPTEAASVAPLACESLDTQRMTDNPEESSINSVHYLSSPDESMAETNSTEHFFLDRDRNIKEKTSIWKTCLVCQPCLEAFVSSLFAMSKYLSNVPVALYPCIPGYMSGNIP